MEWFLYMFGILWLITGICYILYTESSRLVVTKTFENTSNQAFAIIAAVIGLLLIVSSTSSGCPWFFVVLGGIAFLKGVLFWFNPRHVYETLRRWYLHDTSDVFFNIAGIVMVILGTTVILLAYYPAAMIK